MGVLIVRAHRSSNHRKTAGNENFASEEPSHENILELRQGGSHTKSFFLNGKNIMLDILFVQNGPSAHVLFGKHAADVLRLGNISK